MPLKYLGLQQRFRRSGLTHLRDNSEKLAFLESIGILAENISFFQSSRKGTKTGGTVSYRRESDGVTQAFAVPVTESALRAFLGSGKGYIPDIIGQAKRTLIGLANFLNLTDDGYSSKTLSLVYENIDESTISVSGPGADNYIIFARKIAVKPNTLYTLVRNISLGLPGEHSNEYIYNYDSNDVVGSIGSISTLTEGEVRTTFTTDNDTDYILYRCGAKLSDTVNTFGDIRLFKGDCLTGDLPVDQTIEVTLMSKQSTAANQPLGYDNGLEAIVENLLGSDGNFEVDTDENGLGDKWSNQSLGAITGESLSGNIQAFTGAAQYSGIRYIGLSNEEGDFIYSCAYVKADSSLVVYRLQNGIGYVESGQTHSGSGNFEFLSSSRIATSGQTLLAPALRDNRVSGWTENQIKQAHIFNVTELYALSGMAEANFKAWLDEKVQAHIAKYGYITQADIIGLKDSLCYFDGSNDKLQTDVNVEIEGDFSVVVNHNVNSYLAYASLFDSQDNLSARFKIRIDGTIWFMFNAKGSQDIPIDLGNDQQLCFVREGSTITTYVNGVEYYTSTNSGAFTLKFDYLGANWNGDNEFYNGTLNEILITKQALTEEQILALL